MAWATKQQKVVGFTVRGRIGRPMLCGFAMPGWSQCGEDIELAGVYQGRISRKGITLGQPIVGRHEICFMRPCWKQYEGSEAQGVQTDKFKTAMTMWQGLTAEQKAYYNNIAVKKSRRGYNYFLSITLKTL